MKTTCYSNYNDTRKTLRNGTYDLLQDSIGQYNFDNYSIDLTVRQYDELICIDFDVYIKNKDNTEHLDGGKVCNVNKMPLTEKGFWKLVDKKVKEFIQ